MVLDVALAAQPIQVSDKTRLEKHNNGLLHGLGTQQAALRGATLAFGRPVATPSVVINTYSGTSGALLAATKADGARQQLKSKERLVSSSPETTNRFVPNTAAGFGINSRPLAAESVSGSWRHSTFSPEGPSSNTNRDNKVATQLAPSNIAANLASTRYLQSKSTESLKDLSRQSMTSISKPELRDQPSGANRAASGRYVTKPPAPGPARIAASETPKRNEKRPDHSTAVETEHIPATAALIGLFENNKGESKKRDSSEVVMPNVRVSSPAILSPRPLRPLSSSNKHLATAMMIPPPAAPRRKVSAGQNPATQQDEPAAAMRSSSKGRPKPPPRQATMDRNEEQETNPASLNVVADKRAPAPLPPPTRKPGGLGKDSEPPVAIRRRSLSELPTHPGVSASNTVDRGTIPKRQAKPAPAPPSRSIITPASTQSTGRGGSSKQFMTTDSLANAIVASSLASSRAPSPSPTSYPPALPRRHSKPHLLSPHQSHHPRTRSHTPSPTRAPMRQTMRKPVSSSPNSSSSDDNDIDIHHHHRRHGPSFLHKHPHKHHEGTRKRWRDRVTDRERRRYEGVWAANKGLHVHIHTHKHVHTHAVDSGSISISPENAVLNLVVRDIWSRSRLGDHVLEEVWELVDRRGIGVLDREEFVVGMWLIDQRLKGRKLPVKVSLSVWESVRGLSGVRIPRSKT